MYATVFIKWLRREKPISEAKLPSLSGGGGGNSSSVWGGSDKKLRRESEARLNEFAKELRTFRTIDMSGKNPCELNEISLRW
jgi:hypothetical protein